MNYHNYPVEELVISGKVRFRSATIVRNNTGRSGITVGMIFIGECGYFSEAAPPTNIAWYENILVLLKSFL